ncbi:hypothetical protein ASG47_17065 [Devosia sp. Leaf420]|uniref:hypothetical protein n=1 Tax=Devosia sp. Leaf420 TaxID=1736374 RepID=UPI000712E03D|nr:hypothetical protein [Devosia sp. Leaf420]KQT44266.1 hypothetical protein ASG47_17065 [Devosia sp. Leaf420]
MARENLVRLGGLAIVLIGFACLYFFLLVPLQQAQAGVPEVHYELKVFALVPLCFVFGAIFLVFGDGFDYRTPDHQNLTAKGWIAFAVVAVLTGLGWWWFDSQFAALGYV